MELSFLRHKFVFNRRSNEKKYQYSFFPRTKYMWTWATAERIAKNKLWHWYSLFWNVTHNSLVCSCRKTIQEDFNYLTPEDGTISCSETSLILNLCRATSRKSADFIYTEVKAWNPALTELTACNCTNYGFLRLSQINRIWFRRVNQYLSSIEPSIYTAHNDGHSYRLPHRMELVLLRVPPTPDLSQRTTQLCSLT
jgi:hypothetical protein